MWSSSAPVPVPVSGWEAQVGEVWLPVVAIIIDSYGALEACVASPTDPVGWVSKPVMRKVPG